MDRISKVLKKLSAKERAGVKYLLLLISAGNFRELHIKKLRGRKDIFRARKGKIRVIYRVGKSGAVFILAIERRTEKTYRMF